MRALLRDNGLTIALSTMFLLSLLGMICLVMPLIMTNSATMAWRRLG